LIAATCPGVSSPPPKMKRRASPRRPDVQVPAFDAPAPPADPWHHGRHGGPIALNAAEVRRLFHGLVIAPLTTPLRAINGIQYWSSWRRHHQGQARRSHYQHRLATDHSP
jgi:hypothetical protein